MLLVTLLVVLALLGVLLTSEALQVRSSLSLAGRINLGYGAVSRSWSLKPIVHMPRHQHSWLRRPDARLHNQIFQKTALKATSTTEVGDLVVAVVDDIVGSVSDPVVQFLFNNGANKAAMSTRNLTPTERLALQAGAIMQVYVSNIAKNGAITVSLRPPDSTKGQMLDGSFPTNTAPRRFPTSSTLSPASGQLLNQLKTGMKLEGTVASRTQYATFVNVNVIRKGKGGTFTEVNGMLHKADILPHSSKSQMQKGDAVTVYVKEVFKNSGRFTLTTDPGIDKAAILKGKEVTKTEGKERRRSRRLRRLLDNIVVGTTVKGTVLKVIPQGVLVSINSFGPMAITGLLGKNDLPKQYAVPPDLRESFQRQLLMQDFIPGREITCGVMKVTTKTSPNLMYHMKLSYEEFGPLPKDDFVITDKFGEIDPFKSTNGDDDDNDDNNEDNIDGGEGSELNDMDDDVKEIYDELRGKKPQMSAQDVKDWADIQDMVAEGAIDNKAIDMAITRAGSNPKNGFLTLEQFRDFVDILQDVLDGIDVGDNDDDDEDEGEDKVANIKKSNADARDSSAAKASPSSKESEGDADDFDSLIREIFDELRGKEKVIPVAAFKAWDEISEMISSKMITMNKVDDLLKEVGVKKSIDFDQFSKLVEILDDLASEHDESSAPSSTQKASSSAQEKKPSNSAMMDDKNDDDDDDEDQSDEFAEIYREVFDELSGGKPTVSISKFKAWEDIQEMISSKIITSDILEKTIKESGAGKTIDFDQFVKIVENLDQFVSGDEDSSNDNSGTSSTKETAENEEIDEEFKEYAKEMFDSLRGNLAEVPVKAFKAWEDVKEMISLELLTMQDIDDVIMAAGIKNSMNFDEFCDVVEAINDIADASDEDAEVVKKYQEIFDKLKGKNEKLSIANFKKWDAVKSAIEEGVLKMGDIDYHIKETLRKDKEMNFDQFYSLVDVIEGEGDDDDDDADWDESMEDEDDEAEEEENATATPSLDEEYHALAKDLFDELRGKDATCSLQKFKNWGDLKEMIEGKIITQDDVNNVLKRLGVKESLNFDQFYQVVRLIDEIAEGSADPLQAGSSNMEKDAFEEVSREAFEELCGKGAEDMPISTFKAWADVQDMIKSGIVTEALIDASIKKVGAGKRINLEQFCKLIEIIDDAANGGTGNMKAGDNTANDNDGNEEGVEDDSVFQEVGKETFQELLGKTGSDRVPVTVFKSWALQYLSDLLPDKAEAKATLEEVMKVSGIKKSMTYNEFSQLLELLEEATTKIDDDDAEFEVLAGKGFGAASPASTNAVKKTDTSSKALVQHEDDDDNKEDDLVDEDLSIMLNENFDALRGKSDKVSVKAFRNWEEVVGMIQDEVITEKQLNDIISAVLEDEKKKDSLDFEQFSEAILRLDELAGSYEDDEDVSMENQADKYESSSPSDDTFAGSNDDDDDDEMSPEEIEEFTRDLFETLRGNKKSVSVKTFMAWTDLQDMIKEGVIDNETITALMLEVGVKPTSGEMNYDQFKELVRMVDEAASAYGDGSDNDDEDTIAPDEDDDEEEESLSNQGDDDEEEDDYTGTQYAEARNAFDKLRGKAQDVNLQVFKSWDLYKIVIKSGAMKESTLDLVIDAVMEDANSPGKLEFPQFVKLFNLLKDAPSHVESDKQGKNASNNGSSDESIDDDEEDDMDEEGGEPTLEEIEAFAKEIFDQLKNPKTGKVSVKKLKLWEGIKSVIDSGELSKGALAEVLGKVGGDKPGAELDYEAFRKVLDMLEDTMSEGDDAEGEDEEEEEEEEEEKEISTAGKGFGKPAPATAASKAKSTAVADSPSDDDDDEMAEVAREIFDELRGKRKTISVDALKEWDDMKELIEGGALKRSTLEKALQKVGSLATNELTLQQFTKLMDIIQSNVDTAALMSNLEDQDDEDEDEAASPSANRGGAGFSTSKKSQVLSVGNDEDDIAVDENWDESAMEEISEEEAAREIFDTLRKGSPKLSIINFLQWEDVQELLEVGAISKDDLAKAIENTGLTSDAEHMTFEQFFDLVQIIDNFVDKEKLPLDKSDVVFEKRVQVENEGDVNRVMDLVDDLIDDDTDEESLDSVNSGVKLSYIKNGVKTEGMKALNVMQEDIELAEDNEAQDDEEVMDMFKELSKGKSYVTEKALRKWDELQEIIDAELATKEIIDGYIASLGIKDGQVTFNQFKQFINLLDRVLVDEDGEILGLGDEDKAVDLEGISDEDEEDDE